MKTRLGIVAACAGALLFHARALSQTAASTEQRALAPEDLRSAPPDPAAGRPDPGSVIDQSGCLSTAAPNNGRGEANAGIFFDVIGRAGPLLVTEIRCATSSVAGPVNVEIRTCLNSYRNRDGDPAAWTLLGTYPGTSDGTTFRIDTSYRSIRVPSGAFMGVYLVNTTAGGVRYTGTNTTPPQTTWTDGRLEIVSDVARGAPIFTGERFAPRTFSGTICYETDGLSGDACSTVDFEVLALNLTGNIGVGDRYNEDGYTLTKGPAETHYRRWGQLSEFFAGSTGLFNNSPNGLQRLRRLDGAPFSIRSIDLATLNREGPTAVTFTGSYPGGGTVEHRVQVDTQNGNNVFQRFEFPATFEGLDRLEWVQVAPYHQFDNLVLEAPTRVNFEALAQSNNAVNTVGSSYEENGYLFLKGAGEPANYSTFGAQHASFPGSTALFNNTVGGLNILHRVDAQPFDISHIDLATLNRTGPTTVSFAGFPAGVGVPVFQEFVVNPAGGRNVLQRFTFPGSFSGLLRLEWRQNAPFHQFDNLAVVPSTRLDFQVLTHHGTIGQDVGNRYDEDGYRFTKGVGESNPFRVRGTAETRFAGSTCLFNNTVNGVTILERADGKPFNAGSIRLANLNDLGPAPVVFTGTRIDGSQVMFQTEADPSGLPNTLVTRHFGPDFRLLRRLEWLQAAPFHQFDDLWVSCAEVCYACDCDLSSGVGACDIFDFLCFQNRFDSGDPYACDCDTTTGPGLCDIFDFLCFQNEFAAECP